MKLFPIYLYLMFCIFMSSCGSKSNMEGTKEVTVTIQPYSVPDSGAVSYAIGGLGTNDKVKQVTYTLKGGADTSIYNPKSPYFWESPLTSNQTVSFYADLLLGSDLNGQDATIMVYNHKGALVYTKTMQFQ